MSDDNAINKKSLSERDICTKFITPAIKDVVEQLLSLCDALKACLQSADAARERGRLVSAVMAGVGGQDGS